MSNEGPSRPAAAESSSSAPPPAPNPPIINHIHIHIYRPNTRHTDDTASNNPGPGRLVDNIYTKMGKRLDDFVGAMAHKAGIGPEAAAERIFAALSNAPVPRASSKALWSRACSSIFKQDGNTYWTQFNYDSFGKLEEKEKASVKKRCKKIIRGIQSSTPSVRYRALESLFTLSVLFPDLQSIFTQQDAITILTSALSILYVQEQTRGERDELLAPSRRALFSIEDNLMNRFGKELMAVCSVPEEQHEADWYKDVYWRSRDALGVLGFLTSDVTVRIISRQYKLHPVVKRRYAEPNYCLRCYYLAYLCSDARSVEHLYECVEGEYVWYYIKYLNEQHHSLELIASIYQTLAPRLPPLPLVPEEDVEQFIITGKAGSFYYVDRFSLAFEFVREQYPDCPGNHCR